MDDNNKIPKVRRRDRRRKNNRILLLILLFLILLQMVFCVILFVRVSHLEKKMNKLLEIQQVKDDAQIEPATGTHVQKGSEGEESGWSDSGASSSQSKGGTADLSGQDGLNNGTGTGRKMVYLTFDDGPSYNTDKILDILDEYDVKATFFTTGQENPELVHDYSRIVEEGHTIGMHSYSHNYSEIYGSVEAFDEDFNKICGYIEEITGVTPEFYRFPGGSSNLVSKIPMENFVEYLNERGIRYFDWNVSAKDAEGKLLTVDELLDNIFEDIEKHDVCVVLLHDSDELTTTVDMLPKLIERLKGMDALILPITENTKLIQHTVKSVTK